MDMVLISLLMVISTLVSIVKAFLKAMDNTNGKMEIFIVETLRKDLNMAKENGDLEKDLNVINMRETTLVIKSMALVFSNGQVETAIRANTKMMKGTDLER